MIVSEVKSALVVNPELCSYQVHTAVEVAPEDDNIVENETSRQDTTQ